MAAMTLELRPRTRGQALVEFAIVFPVLFLTLCGIIDFGRAIYAYNALGNAARVGTRVATVNQILTTPGRDCDEAQPIQSLVTPHWSVTTCAANAAISLGVQASDVSVFYSSPPSQPHLPCPAAPTTTNPLHVGCLVTVTVPYTWTPLTPVISSIWPAIPMSYTSQTSIERVFP
jgi:Flp pilus assembly protein TadG